MRGEAPERVANAGANRCQCDTKPPSVLPTPGEYTPIRGAALERVANAGIRCAAPERVANAGANEKPMQGAAPEFRLLKVSKAYKK
jgi:hypothetical protein